MSWNKSWQFVKNSDWKESSFLKNRMKSKVLIKIRNKTLCDLILSELRNKIEHTLDICKGFDKNGEYFAIFHVTKMIAPSKIKLLTNVRDIVKEMSDWNLIDFDLIDHFPSDNLTFRVI